MEFPAPPPVGPHERSIAERHRMIVLLASVFGLLPVGFVMRQLVATPWLVLLSTLVVSFLLTYLLTQFLRRSFLRIAAGSELVLRPTLRPLARRSGALAQELSTAGFAVSDVVVVVTESGHVLTRPMALMQRHHDSQMFQISSVGSQAATYLSNDTWLVTATTSVVNHPRLLVQRAKKHDVHDVLRLHGQALAVLADHGVVRANQPSPLQCAQQLERFEVETLARLREGGASSPTSKELLDSGTPVTGEVAATWGAAHHIAGLAVRSFVDD